MKREVFVVAGAIIKDNKVFDKDENLIGFIYVTLE